MADELTISASLAFSKNGVTPSLAFIAEQFDVSGTDYIRNTQTVGTTAEALDIGDITTPGYIIVANLDATNFMEFRSGSGGTDVVKVRAGGFGMFELATTTPFVIADSSSVQIEYLLVEA